MGSKLPYSKNDARPLGILRQGFSTCFEPILPKNTHRTVQKLHSMQFTVCTVCSVQIVRHAVCSVLSVHGAMCPVHSVQCAVCVRVVAQWHSHTHYAHCTKCIVWCIKCSVQCVECTVCHVAFTTSSVPITILNNTQSWLGLVVSGRVV